MVAAVGAGTAISATPATASTDYVIDQNAATQACRYTDSYPLTFGLWGNLYNNTYQWECMEYHWTVYAPGFYITMVGVANLQNYCSITYPGSQAVKVSSDSNGWHCRQP